MFKRVLIANRGLIAANCVRACKELGASAILLFEDADRESAAVRNADEAYLLEHRNPQVRPYLDAEQILELAVSLKVDAMHPGYGFLAQNRSFARQLASRAITCITPRAMGSATLPGKSEQRAIAKDCGITVIEASETFEDLKTARRVAAGYKYPYFLKAEHGYGGIGMQRVTKPGQFERVFTTLKASASQFRLDSSKFSIEPALEGSRLIEFPVLRDESGRTMVFPELEGTVQRRFQRLLVESPSAGLDENLRQDLQSRVRLLCDRLEMQGFASVEFLVRGEKATFLEINGHFHPAHTATTILTGVDLLKEQIRLASGEALKPQNGPMRIDRYVLGAFVFAEDPLENFAPSPGSVDRLYLPFGDELVIQTSIFSGAVISPFYDPMVAKLLARGMTREEARLKLTVALEEFFVEGVRTNIPFLRGLLESPEFKEGVIYPEQMADADFRKRIVEDLKSDRDHQVAALVAALALHRDGDTQERVRAAVDAEGSSVFSAAARWLRPRKNRRNL
jgi:acetyl-CoA carboxylase biotin carboxylase subunit